MYAMYLDHIKPNPPSHSIWDSQQLYSPTSYPPFFNNPLNPFSTACMYIEVWGHLPECKKPTSGHIPKKK